MIYSRIREVALKLVEKVAIIDDEVSLSYRQLLNCADLLSEKLQNNNLHENDRVIVLLDTSAIAIVSLLSINKIGGIFIPLSTKLPEYGLEQLITYIEPNLIITNINNYNKVAKYQDKVNILVLDLNDSDLIYSINGKEKESVKVPTDFLLDKTDCVVNRDNNIAEILFTSGTTGKPKGIMLSNHNICSNVGDIIDYMNICPLDVSLIVKPLMHSSTLNGEIITSLFAGSTIVTTQKLITPGIILNYIKKYKVTVLFLIPTLLIKVLNYNRFNVADISSLRILNFYGSSIPNNIMMKCIESLPHVEIIYSYGLTEASPRVTYIKTQDILKRIGSSGKALRHVTVTIRDDDQKKILVPYKIGEIFVEGPNIMQGYFKDDQLTKSALTENGLKTGDLGYFDEDGFLYVVGRKDEMIIKGGVNIYPAEIENILSLCPVVEQVLVKGVYHSELGQLIEAYIVCKKELCGETDSITVIYNHCKKYLEPNKIPNKINIVDKLELTYTGKVKRS